MKNLKRNLAITIVTTVTISTYFLFQNFTYSDIPALSVLQNANCSTNLSDPILSNMQSAFCDSQQKLRANPIFAYFDNCQNAGNGSDYRGPGIQYSCNELPIGTTDYGNNLAVAQAAEARLKGIRGWQAVIDDGLDTEDRSSRNSPVAAAYRNYLSKQNGYKTWLENKRLFQSAVPYSDNAGNNRSININIGMKRVPVSKYVSILMASENVNTKSDNILGRHFIRKYAPATFELCSVFPGTNVFSDRISADYTIWQYRSWWANWDWTVSGTIDPGSIDFHALSMCNLVGLRVDGNNLKLVVLGSKQPTLHNFNKTGFSINIDLGILNSLTLGLANSIANRLINNFANNASAQIVATLSANSSSDWSGVNLQMDTTPQAALQAKYLDQLTSTKMLTNEVLPALQGKLDGLRLQLNGKAQEVVNKCKAMTSQTQSRFIELGGDAGSIQNICNI